MIATTVIKQIEQSDIKAIQSDSDISPENYLSSEDASKCVICDDAAHGMHFGVAACRACAAFFRRSTITSRKYICRFGGNCDVGKDVRCCCRACRLTKCLSFGMKTDAVQRHRDNIGPRRRQDSSPTTETSSPNDRVVPINFSSPFADIYSSNFHPNGLNNSLPVLSTPPSVSSTSSTATFFDKGKTYTLLTNAIASPTTSSGSSSTLITPCYEQPSTSITIPSYSNSAFTAVASNIQNPIQDIYSHLITNSIYSKLNLPQNHPMPLCTEILRGYKKLCSLRKTTNRLRDEAGLLKLFDDNVEITEGTYNDNVATIKNDLSLVSEMISDHFVPLSRFSVNAKWALLRNFFCPFILLERSFNTARLFPDKNDQRMLISSRHYAQLDNLAKFFDVENCKGTPEDVARVFEKTFAKIRQLVVNTFIDLNLSDEEFSGILGALFWSETFDGLTEEEDSLAEETRNAAFEELYYACRCRVSSVEELGIRYGVICNLIPIVKRAAVEMADGFSVVNVLNIFDVDTFLHKVLPHTF
uniref:Uncharacterized protein n=1 Tax=Panagrolaimus sp. PS1159 TaxID=55785 RepID=A0AC35F981_9BILA